MDFETARYNMVEGQIRTNEVSDPRVVDVFLNLPREKFVPKGWESLAYIDDDIRLPKNRVMLEPMVLARLMEVAKIKESDMALVVGAGSGFEAAAIGRLAETVVALEDKKTLAKAAAQALDEVGADNVAVVHGKLTKGYAKQAPYDVIFIIGAAQEIPDTLDDQLAEGGRLLAVRLADPDKGGGMGRAVMRAKFHGVVSEQDLFDAGTPALPEFQRKPVFEF